MGLIFKRFNLPTPSLVLGLVIGPIFEVQFRRSMLIGGWSYFVGRPAAIGLFRVTIVLSYWVLRSGSRSGDEGAQLKMIDHDGLIKSLKRRIPVSSSDH